MGLFSTVTTVLKIVPLGIYLRAACCKFQIPVLGCDGPLCPVALGQPSEDGCSPTGNTAELKAWCENAWTPWLNGLLGKTGLTYVVSCTEADNYSLLKILGTVLTLSYIGLWLKPRTGSLLLTFYMAFGLHFHLTFLKEELPQLGLQIALFCSSLIIYVYEAQSFMKEKAA